MSLIWAEEGNEPALLQGGETEEYCARLPELSFPPLGMETCINSLFLFMIFQRNLRFMDRKSGDVEYTQ